MSVCPSKPEFCIEAGLFRTLVLETPIALAGLRSSLRMRELKTRAMAPERALARVCREAGATVRCNARLRDIRAIEVLATGLPLFFRAQLAVDITLRCALAADGTAMALCAPERARTKTKYSELLRGDRCRGVSHDSPRTPNVHTGPQHFKHHQNSTRRPPEREEKNEFCGGTGKKKARHPAVCGSIVASLRRDDQFPFVEAWGRATRRFAMQGWSFLFGKIWLSTERRKMMRNSTPILPDVGGSRKLLSVLTLSLWQQTCGPF